jgi:hypothetical protein
MAKLKVKIKGNTPGNDRYHAEVNGDNFKEVAVVLNELRIQGIPIDKAYKESKIPKSDWDAALGF